MVLNSGLKEIPKKFIRFVIKTSANIKMMHEK